MEEMSDYSIKITEEDKRLTTFPIARPEIFRWYETAIKCYWTPDEIVFDDDRAHFQNKLTAGERHFVTHVLAFFAASDGIVNLNLASRFKNDIPILEVGYFYDFQIAMENIHAHTYSILLDKIIANAGERQKLLTAIRTMPVIKKMSDYMFHCIDSNEPFGARLLRMACVEGIFFQGCFCAIYWLQSRGLMPALGQSNELIARDEGLHTYFALFLYKNLTKPLGGAVVERIFREAVDLASEFIDAALPVRLPEMNADLMKEYIQCCADNLLTLIDRPVIFRAKQRFHYMDQINMKNKTMFFERKVSEYAKKSTVETDQYAVDENF